MRCKIGRSGAWNVENIEEVKAIMMVTVVVVTIRIVGGQWL